MRCPANAAAASCFLVRPQAILPAIYTALVAALGVVVSGLVTLPSLARDELRDVLSDTLRTVGTSVTGSVGSPVSGWMRKGSVEWGSPLCKCCGWYSRLCEAAATMPVHPAAKGAGHVLACLRWTLQSRGTQP